MFNTFKGGINPPGRKELTEQRRLENLSIPQVCCIPLQQHAGVPAVPVVKPGDSVEEGQVIGKAAGEGSVHVHASVPGRVLDVTQSAFNNNHPVIVIEAEGSFNRTGSAINVSDWNSMSRDELAGKAFDAGIIGLGSGATVSDITAGGGRADVLIVNCAEGEPYLTADDMIFKTFPAEIVEGIKIALKILDAKKAVIVMDRNSDAIVPAAAALKDAGMERVISIRKIKSKYPSGSLRHTVYTVLKKKIKSGESLNDAGISVHDTATIFALREAVLYNKPLIERYITVSGSMINRPGNYKIRIGTKISDIIEECGGLKTGSVRAVIGGPLNGVEAHTYEIPVTKSTRALLFLSADETRSSEPDACIRCGRCVKACPMGLVPCAIAAAAEKSNPVAAAALHADQCIMCGSCAYICPAARPLTALIKQSLEKKIS